MSGSHTSSHMSPAQAAQVAEVSRWTILRAIKSHELQASRDNRNHWRITRDDLDIWRGHTVRTVEDLHTSHTPRDTAELRERLAAETTRADVAEAMLAREQAAMNEMRADRDRWHEAYRDAARKSDPILPVAFTVISAAALAALANGLTMKDSPMGWLSILLGGVLLVMSIAIAARIRGQHTLRDGDK